MGNKKITYDIGFNTDAASLDKIRQQLSSLSQYTMNDLLKVNTSATEADLERLKQSVATVQNALNQSYNLKLDSTNIQSFNQHLKNSGTSIQQLAKDFAKAGVQGQVAFRNMATDLMTSNTQLKQAHSLLDSMAKTLSNTIKWSIASTAINTVTGSVQKAWGFTKSLDESLTNIRIVTGQSADEMDRFTKQAQKSAKALGAATTQYTNAALIFYQQGLNDTDVQARTEATIKAANVTGQSAAEVSEQLTAVWNGYKVVAEEAELYVDRLAAVAATTAADLEELSTGMSKVASAANTMGVNIDQLSAQLSTIVSVTRQDASLVGTALKTIYARMGDLKVDGVDEFGTSLGDVSSQMRQMGISVLDQEGNLRDMGMVIEEVAAKWETWTSAQQQAAAVAIAGKRQYNNLIALFDNWNMYESALTTSQTSAGTLQKQQDIYFDSIEGRLEELNVAKEKVYDSLFNSESMKDLIDALTTGTELLAGFIKSIGGGGQVLANFGAIAMTVFRKHLSGGIATAITNLTAFHSNTMAIAGEIQEVEKMRLIAEEKEIPLLNNLVEAKRQQLNYARILTAEQKKQWDDQIKSLNTTQNEVALAEEKEKQIENELKTAQELLKTKKILTTLSGPAAKPELLRAGEALTDSELRERQKGSGSHYNAGSVTEFKEFNLETQEGRDAAVKDIESRDSNLAEQEKLANKTFQTVNTGGVDPEQRVAEIATYSEEIDTFTQGYAGNTEDITELITLNENLTEAQAEYNAALQETLAAKAALSAEEAKLQQLQEDDASEIEIKAQEAVIAKSNAEAKTAEAKAAKALNAVNAKARKVVQEHSKVVQQNRQELTKVSKVIKDYTKNTKKAAGETEVARQKLKNAKTEMQKFVKSIKIKAIADNIVGIVGGVSQMASAISTLTNLGDIFNDESLSGAEKFLAVTQNLGMALPMLVGGFGSVFTVIKNVAAATSAASLAGQKQLLLQQSQNREILQSTLINLGYTTTEELKEKSIEDVVNSLDKEKFAQLQANMQTAAASAGNLTQAATEEIKGEAGKKAGNKLFWAGIKAQLGFWPLLVIGLAIAAVLATIIALIAIFGGKHESALEKANKALEKEKETLAAVNEQYKVLKEELKEVADSFDKLNEKQKVINDLQVGTEEWTKAVQENNQAVLELLSTYSELSGFIQTDENGVMSISTEGQDMLEDKLEGQTNRAYAQTLFQQSEVFKADNTVKDLTAGAKLSDNSYLIDVTGENKGLKEAFAIAEVEAFRNAFSQVKSDNYNGHTGEYDVEKIRAQIDAQYGEGAYDSYNEYYNTDDEVKAIVDTNYDDEFYYNLQEILSNATSQDELVAQIAETFDMEQAASEELADAIWEEKDAIFSNVASINNNTDAVERLEAAYAAQFFADNKQRAEAQSTSAWDALMGDEITKAVEDQTGKVEDDKASDGDDYGQLNDAAKENYAKSLGVSVDEIEMTDDGKIKVKGADDSTAVRLKDAAELANQYAAATQAEGQAERITNLVNRAYQAADEVGAGSLINLSGGQRKVSLDQNTTTLEDVANLDASRDAIFKALKETGEYADDDAVARALGYEDKASYDAAYQRTKLDAQSTVKKLNAGHLNDTFNAENFSGATLTQAKNIADAFEAVFQNAGNAGAEALNDMLSQFSDDPKTQEKIASIASSIDWTDINAEKKFKAALEDANVYVDESSEYWKQIVDSMEDAANVAGSIAHKFSSIRGDLAEIKSLAGGLKLGDVVSDEDYKNMIKYNSAAKDMFIQTADGYEFIGGSGKELQAVLSEGYTDLNKIRKDFNLLSDAASNFDAIKEDIKLNNSTAQNKEVANKIIQTAGYEHLLAAQGVNADNFNKALEIISDPNADKGSEDYKNAVATMEAGISAVSQSLADNAVGLFSGDQAVETWISYNADSWAEAKKMLDEQGYAEEDKVYQKFAEKWKNSFLNELGFSGSMSSLLGVDELEKHLRNVRELELDYYQEINSELTRIGTQIERAFSADKLALMAQQVELQKESQQIAYEQYAKMQETYTALATDFLANASANYGISASELVKEDGSLDINALKDLQLNYAADSEEYANIENLISMWSKVDEAATSATESAWELVDAQIEAFRYQTELQREIRESTKQWIEFSKQFADYGKKGLGVFEEQNAVDMINNAFNDYAMNKGFFNSISEDIEKMNPIAQSVANLSDEYNRAAIDVQTKQGYLSLVQRQFANTTTDALGKVDQAKAEYLKLQDAEKTIENAEKKVQEADTKVTQATKNRDTANTNKDKAQGFYDAAEGALRTAISTTDGKRTALNNAGASDGKSKKQKALDEAEDAQDDAQKARDTKLREYNNAKAEAAYAENALKAAESAKANAEKELENLKGEFANKSSQDLEKDKNAALDNYAQALRDMGVQVQESGYTFESLNEAYSQAVAKVADGADQIEDAQQAVLDAQKVQRTYAERIAENNPYATVAADGSLIWDENAFKEDWEGFLSEGRDTLLEMQENLQNLYDGFLQAQEELMGLFDKEIEKLNQINSILTGSADLWKLIGKNVTGYSTQLNSYYKAATANTQQAFLLAQGQYTAAEYEFNALMELADTASEEMKETVTNNLATATENVISSMSEWMDALSTEFSETLSATIDEFVGGLDSVSEQWELAKNQDNRYLDEVNEAYARDTLSRNFQKSIDETTSITAQNKLMEARLKIEKDLASIKEKQGKLTQYDLDRANAMYELTLKQIALEEAQQTANKMKLTRDMSGNYTYQYVADEDAIAKAQEELAAAENELYNMDKERNQTLVDEYYSLMSEANSAISEAMASGDMDRVTRLKDYYFGEDGLISGIQAELETAQVNLDTMGQTLMGTDWTSSLRSFTDAIVGSDMSSLLGDINTLVSTTTSSFSTMQDSIANLLDKQDGILPAAIGNLNSTLLSTDDIVDRAVDLVAAAQNVIDQLPSLAANIKDLEKILTDQGKAYTDWLAAQANTSTEISNNTVALVDNTTALNTFSEALTSRMTGSVVTDSGTDELGQNGEIT